MEMLFDVILTVEEWMPVNGMLTAAMKVNRGKVKEVFSIGMHTVAVLRLVRLPYGCAVSKGVPKI
jgi:hypothetical protein